MAKHKTKKEGIYGFKKYEKEGGDGNEYYKTINFTTKSNGQREGWGYKKKCARGNFKTKYNLGKKLDNTFMDKKIKKGSKKTEKEKFERGISDLTNDQLKEIARRYYEITKDKDKKDALNEISEINLSANVLSALFDVCRQSISKRRNGFKPKVTRSCKTEKYYSMIINAFEKNYKNYGKVRLNAEILNKHGVNIPISTILYSMNKIGLKCKIREARKDRENKVVDVKYTDLVNRDYNMLNVYSTDVKYLRCNDLPRNFGYLSIAINTKTKMIEGVAFSKTNGLDFVMETYKQLDLEGKVIHSDHGGQYSHKDIVKHCKDNNAKISMSRIGNSLDNREAEYFFSNLESECLKKYKLYLMSFEEVKAIVSDYIKGYNNVRIQSILNGKTPAEASVYSC